MANIIEMPKLSDTMTVGTLVKWLKKEGDNVKSGDMLAEVETDKATMELESFFDGVLLKQFAPAGAQVAIGAPLAAIGKAGEKVEAPASKAPAAEAPAAAPAPAVVAAAPAAPTPAPTPAPAPAPAPVAPAAPAPSGRVKISPLARKLAEEKKIDFTRVTGTGPGGRIVRADIIAAEKNPPAAPAKAPAAGKPEAVWPWRSVTDKAAVQAETLTAPSSMRATIARRLLESKTQIPHVYLEIEVDVEPLLALREQLNAGLAKDKVKLSVNDFVLKASAAALRAVPVVNTSWEATGIKAHGAVHVSFAVAIDEGLITPVIRDTDKKTIMQISAEAKELGKKAKDKKLTPAEFTGGTFCVSNLGMMGIERFCAIINPPNAAILAVGTTVKKPVVKGDQIVIGQRMSLTLSCDHRIVDGAVGAKFLNALRDHLQNPALLLL